MVLTTPGFTSHCTTSGSMRSPLVDVTVPGKATVNSTLGVGAGQRGEVGPAFQNHHVAVSAQRQVHSGGVGVHVGQLGQLGEGQIGKDRLRPHETVAVVVRDGGFLTERQVSCRAEDRCLYCSWVLRRR